jgi:cytochrome c oxidase subunit 2
MAVAIILILLVLGSVAFHLFSPWWQTPIASNWGSIDSALHVTLWICGIVFIAINLFIALAIIRYRHRQGHRADYEPENAALEKRLTLWTGIGIAGMLAPGLIAWNQYVTIPKDAAVIEATGQQWQWSFRLPGNDGVLGTSDVHHISADNPFGINPEDPYGRDDVLVESGEVYLPVGKPVKVLLRSKDVLHDFYVPQFRAKMDLVPGILTYFWVTPTRTGTFEILCAELCGVGHHAMRGTVVVADQKTYQGWLGEQLTFAQINPDQVARNDVEKVQLAQAESSGALTGGGE